MFHFSILKCLVDFPLPSNNWSSQQDTENKMRVGKGAVPGECLLFFGWWGEPIELELVELSSCLNKGTEEGWQLGCYNYGILGEMVFC